MQSTSTCLKKGRCAQGHRQTHTFLRTRNEGPQTGSCRDTIALLREETVIIHTVMTTAREKKKTSTCSQLSVKQRQNIMISKIMNATLGDTNSLHSVQQDNTHSLPPLSLLSPFSLPSLSSLHTPLTHPSHNHHHIHPSSTKTTIRKMLVALL